MISVNVSHVGGSPQPRSHWFLYVVLWVAILAFLTGVSEMLSKADGAPPPIFVFAEEGVSTPSPLRIEWKSSSAVGASAEIEMKPAERAALIRTDAGGYGTAVVIGSEPGRGLALTCSHVASTARGVSIRVGDEWIDAQVERRSITNDIALLSFPDARRFSPVAVRRVNFGEPLTRLGKKFPTNSIEEQSDSVFDANYAAAHAYFRTNKPAVPGNSGGPVFGRDGQLVGLVYATDSTRASVVDGESLRGFLADERPFVTVWKAPFPCVPCDKLATRLKAGTNRVRCEYLTGSPPWLEAWKSISGKEAFFPMLETTVAGEWRTECVAGGKMTVEEVETWAAPRAVAGWRDPEIGTIHGRQVVRQSLQMVDRVLGPAGKLQVTWKRVGERSIDLRQPLTRSRFAGNSGEVSIRFVDCSSIPPGWPDHFEFSYVRTGDRWRWSFSTVETVWPDESTSGIVGDQRVGSPLLMAYTVISLAWDVYSLLHPKITTEFPETLALSARMQGPALQIDFTSPPKIQADWSALFGLLHFRQAIAMKSAELSPDQAVARFDSRVIRSAALSIKD